MRVENSLSDEKLALLSLEELRARAAEHGVVSDRLLRAELIHAVKAAESGKNVMDAVHRVGILISSDIGELLKIPTDVLFTITQGLEVPVPKTVSAAVVASVIAEKRRGSLMSTLHVAEMVHELTQVEAARVHAERVAMAAVPRKPQTPLWILPSTRANYLSLRPTPGETAWATRPVDAEARLTADTPAAAQPDAAGAAMPWSSLPSTRCNYVTLSL